MLFRSYVLLRSSVSSKYRVGSLDSEGRKLSSDFSDERLENCTGSSFVFLYWKIAGSLKFSMLFRLEGGGLPSSRVNAR